MKLNNATLRQTQPGSTWRGLREQGTNRAAPIDVTQPLRLELPLRIYSEANRSNGSKGASYAFYARKKQQRNAVLGWMLTKGRPWIEANHTAPVLTVTLTRIGKGLLDDDNLANGFKSVRDAVARAFGIDDGNRERWRWVYNAERAKEYGVVIEIEVKR